MGIKSIKQQLAIHSYCALMVGTSDKYRELAESQTDPREEERYMQLAAEHEKYQSPDWHRDEYKRLSEELDKRRKKRVVILTYIFSIASVLITVLGALLRDCILR